MPRISVLSSFGGDAAQVEAVPLHLTASVNLPPNGQSAPNSEALMNPMGVPMEISEIKFRILAPFSDGSPVSGAASGGGVGCRMDFGQVALSNGFVPLFSYCRAYNPYDESINTGGFQDYVFQLPKPLYVPAGRVIQPQFQHFGQTNNSLDIDISFSGRSLLRASKPKNIYLPYVSAYKSEPLIVDGGTAETAESQEVDLKNPFNHELNIERFVGRTDFNRTTDSTNTVYELSSTGNANYELDQLNIRMFDSRGEPIIPLFTPFGAVFPKYTRSWECAHVLGSQGYYKVFLEKSVGSDEPVIVTYSQAYVSMIGWHEVPLAGI